MVLLEFYFSHVAFLFFSVAVCIAGAIRLRRGFSWPVVLQVGGAAILAVSSLLDTILFDPHVGLLDLRANGAPPWLDTFARTRVAGSGLAMALLGIGYLLAALKERPES